MNPTQPRKPAGSTEGGQFAATQGPEASTELEDVTVPSVQEMSARYKADLDQCRESIAVAERALFETGTRALIEMARSACPDLERIRWDELSPLSGPTRFAHFDCPHMEPGRGRRPIDFELAHGLRVGSISSSSIDTVSSADLATWGKPMFGIRIDVNEAGRRSRYVLDMGTS